MPIYKIFRAPEWAELNRAGETRGSPVDLADGFIHFSAAAQVAGTAARHFADQDGLILAACDAVAMGDDLRWEWARGGALFPHLYRALRLADVLWARPLLLGPNGHILPGDMT